MLGEVRMIPGSQTGRLADLAGCKENVYIYNHTHIYIYIYNMVLRYVLWLFKPTWGRISKNLSVSCNHRDGAPTGARMTIVWAGRCGEMCAAHGQV